MRTRRQLLPRALAVAVLVSASASATAARPAGASVVRTPGDPAYVTLLRTGAKGRVWTGTHRISFTNLDSASLSTLYLRVWSNGVDGCQGGDPAIAVTGLQGGTIVDDTALGCTELEVVLDAPLAPGDRATLDMGLRIEVPAKNDRFGYHGGLALMGTALPTLEVHDDLGWHHDPFIDLGESFYSIVGRYRVTLDTPDGLDTPTTGVATMRTSPASGRTATTYVARDVRDFAWAAGRLRHVDGPSGRTRVRVSYRPDAVSRSAALRALADSRRALHTFSASFGAFPYPEMDVVLARFTTFGGMEYPTVIFTNPDRFTVSHEVAHQWWYAIVGDDEYAEPWLDESFATWSESLPFDPSTRCRHYPFPVGARLTNDMEYWASHPNQYRTIYSGGGCMLANLAHRFGLPRFVKILGLYASRHWFGVARTADFTRAIDRAALTFLPHLDMDAYWHRWRVR
jgi:hypothetical protein